MDRLTTPQKHPGPHQRRAALDNNGYYASHGAIIIKDCITVACPTSTMAASSSASSSTSSRSSSRSSSPVHRHRPAGVRKHTIPFGRMCRMIREMGANNHRSSSSSSKKSPARIVLRRSTSQASQ